jgi:hypothetical protein
MHQRHRQPLGIVVDPVLLLPPGRIQTLPEIPLAVEQANRYQGERLIGCLLDQVAGERAQPARVHRQRMMHAVLRAQESDRVLWADRSDGRTP